MENLTAYLIGMGISVLLCGSAAFFLNRNDPSLRKASVRLTIAEIGLGLLLGLLCAKAAYFLLRIRYLLSLGAGSFFSTLKPEELSFFGGVAGVLLAVSLSARVCALPVGTVMNRFAPAGALMIACARFCEGFLGMLGVGSLPEETVLPFPLGIGIDFSGDGSYVEYYLAVFMLEGITALLTAVWALKAQKKSAGVLIRALFYICLIQVFWESLRSSSITWLFVRLEQLACFLFAEGVLFLRGLKSRPAGGWWKPAAIGLCVCALLIGVEYALDKSGISHLLLYACMLLGLGVMVWAEHLSLRKKTA